MRLVTDVPSLRAALGPGRGAGQTIGLVPTMGALHEGHLALVRAAAAECDVVVVSIFVNPLQFSPGEDFETYPRDRDRDRDLLEPLGVDVVFVPHAETFTPPDRLTTVHVEALTARMEGASRPGHFDGVTTIVTKLLNAAMPDRAYFGEKDYQQLAVIRRMVADLDVPAQIVGCPIIRDDDGLALSSRNAYLSAEERSQALALSRGLFAVAQRWDGDAGSARELLRTTLAHAPGVRLDYAEVCDPETLEPLEGVVAGRARALVAAHVGATRLIDNVRLDPPPADRGGD